MENSKPICQCCGMPLDETTVSHETNGDINTEYCKWCYADGTFKYESVEQLINFCAAHCATGEWTAEKIRTHMESMVPNLRHWQKK